MTATTIVHLGSLAEQINVEHRAVEETSRGALAHAFEAGRLLLKAKAELHANQGYGNWGAWLADNVECSDRTAQLYMQIASSPQLEDPQRVAELSLRAAAREVAKPRTTSVSDVAGLMRSLNTSTEAGNETMADVGERIDRARERLRADAAVAWTSQQERKMRRAQDLLKDATDKVGEAGRESLSFAGVAGLLKQAALSTRHAASVLDELAATFER